MTTHSLKENYLEGNRNVLISPTAYAVMDKVSYKATLQMSGRHTITTVYYYTAPTGSSWLGVAIDFENKGNTEQTLDLNQIVVNSTAGNEILPFAQQMQRVINSVFIKSESSESVKIPFIVTLPEGKTGYLLYYIVDKKDTPKSLTLFNSKTIPITFDRGEFK